MYAHVFKAGPGEDWTRVARCSSIADLGDAERCLRTNTGVRLSHSQPLSHSEAVDLSRIDYERIRGACRYYDSSDPSVQYRIVLVNE